MISLVSVRVVKRFMWQISIPAAWIWLLPELTTNKLIHILMTTWMSLIRNPFERPTIKIEKKKNWHQKCIIPIYRISSFSGNWWLLLSFESSRCPAISTSSNGASMSQMSLMPSRTYSKQKLCRMSLYSVKVRKLFLFLQNIPMLWKSSK